MALTALPALAQDTRSDEVIVTATKIAKSVNDLGLSVSVVEGEPLSRTDSAEELTQYVSGLQAAVANGNQIAFQIRGIGAVDHQALTPTAAAVYIDGVFQATNVQTGPLLFDLERAEVLKGPQGSLYGRNATAGAINFISKRPTDTSEGYVAAELGNFNRVNIRAASNIPVSDIFALRVSGRYLSQGPMIDNVVTDAAVTAPKAAGGERDEFGLRALGLLQASPKTEVLLNVHYAADNGVNPSPRNEGLDVGKHEISVGPDGIQDTDNEFYGASVTVTHDAGNFDLTSLTAFEGYNQDYGFDFAALPQFFGGQTANLAYDRDFAQVSQELRLSYTTDRLESMVGVYLEAEDFDQEYVVFCGSLNEDTLVGSCNYIAAARRVGAAPTPAGASASTLQSLITQERKTAALFSYNTIALAPQLDVVLGGRLTTETIQGRGQGNHIFDTGEVGINNTLAGGEIVGPAIGSNTLDETNFSGNIGLNFTPNDSTLIYATLSNGFKSGGFNGEVIDNAAHFDDEGLFGSETVTAGEVGIKFTTNTLRFALSGFYNDYDDPQARFFREVTLENGQTIGLNSLSNFKSATSYGADIDLSATLSEGLDVGASATLLKTKIKDRDQPALDGDDLPFASDFSGTAFARYQWAISETITGQLQANAKYQTDFTTGVDSATATAFRQDGYGLIDAEAKLMLDNGVELGLWGRNLNNADYASSAYRFFGATTFRGNPRSYGVALRYDY
ncbi:TonB-dependent receptor [Litorimonas sp. RW-G-Af-16]